MLGSNGSVVQRITRVWCPLAKLWSSMASFGTMWREGHKIAEASTVSTMTSLPDAANAPPSHGATVTTPFHLYDPTTQRAGAPPLQRMAFEF